MPRLAGNMLDVPRSWFQTFHHLSDFIQTMIVSDYFHYNKTDKLHGSVPPKRIHCWLIELAFMIFDDLWGRFGSNRNQLTAEAWPASKDVWESELQEGRWASIRVFFLLWTCCSSKLRALPGSCGDAAIPPSLISLPDLWSLFSSSSWCCELECGVLAGTPVGKPWLEPYIHLCHSKMVIVRRLHSYLVNACIRYREVCRSDEWQY